MMDANEGFVKDGNKNHLREQDIHKIVDVFNHQIEIEGYSRMVSHAEIAENEYNLNIPRYIDKQEEEDIQDIEAHLLGGIPERDINLFKEYWEVFPAIKDVLFKSSERPNYVELNVDKDNIKETIFNHEQFIQYKENVYDAIRTWKQANEGLLYNLHEQSVPKEII